MRLRSGKFDECVASSGARRYHSGASCQRGTCPWIVLHRFNSGQSRTHSALRFLRYSTTHSRRPGCRRGDDDVVAGVVDVDGTATAQCAQVIRGSTPSFRRKASRRSRRAALSKARPNGTPPSASSLPTAARRDGAVCVRDGRVATFLDATNLANAADERRVNRRQIPDRKFVVDSIAATLKVRYRVPAASAAGGAAGTCGGTLLGSDGGRVLRAASDGRDAVAGLDGKDSRHSHERYADRTHATPRCRIDVTSRC